MDAIATPKVGASLDFPSIFRQCLAYRESGADHARPRLTLEPVAIVHFVSRLNPLSALANCGHGRGIRPGQLYANCRVTPAYIFFQVSPPL